MSLDPAPAPPRSDAVLHVRTVALDGPVDLRAHIPATSSCLWLHDGEGFVGLGVAWQVRTRGRDRFDRAREAFAAAAQHAVVRDEARTRISGLLAAGTFSYAADSERASTLIVPQLLLGVTDGRAVLTAVGLDEDPVLPEDWRALFTPSAPVEAGSPLSVEPGHTPDEYQELVRTAVRRIREGRAAKVVLSERSRVRSAGPIRPETVAARLAELFPSCWTYRVGDVLGASPEMLARTERGTVFSRVLAGTRPVNDTAGLTDEERAAFAADPKERSEHEFAVRSVTEPLAELADTIDASPEPFVLRLPGLEHLASDVTARLREGVTSLDVAARLHPSAAVSGTPREAADEIIADLEPTDRGGYAAPVGWMSADGDGEWAIALRMAHLVDERTVDLQTGGGLVAASDPVAEHAEVLAKTRPMLRALRGTA